MVAIRLLSRAEMERRLSPYGCRRVAVLQPGLELWETGWGYPFTLSVEAGGRFDEWQYTQVITRVVARTMPEDWPLPDNGNGT